MSKKPEHQMWGVFAMATILVVILVGGIAVGIWSLVK